jgi:nicotinamidase-related amidase
MLPIRKPAPNKMILALACILSVGVLSPVSIAPAQAQDSVRSSILPTGGGAALLDPSDTVFLLLDHQAGLFQTVKDITVAELRSNTVTLAKLATLMKIPVITTASEPNGTNGPLMPEIHEFAPHAVYVARKGEVNAWDNEDFVKAVNATGRRQLIIAGVVTDVCVAFVTPSALQAGYEVFVVTDASGTFNTAVREAAWTRMANAGAQLMNWFGVACELHRD